MVASAQFAGATTASLSSLGTSKIAVPRRSKTCDAYPPLRPEPLAKAAWPYLNSETHFCGNW
jgi:hypothetical protein